MPCLECTKPQALVSCSNVKVNTLNRNVTLHCATDVHLVYFELECVEKSRSPAGKVNGMCENMNKKSINMDKKNL